MLKGFSDPKQNVKEKHERGDQDNSAEAARKIARRIENEGGFWGEKCGKKTNG